MVSIVKPYAAAAAAAKSLQSCPTLCDPIDGSPPGSPVPGILQARTLIEGRRRRGRQRMKWLDDITDSIDMGLGRLRHLVMDRKAWHGVAKSRT